MSNMITNDASKAQVRCKQQDTACKMTGVTVLRDPQYSKVRFQQRGGYGFKRLLANFLYHLHTLICNH